MKLLAIAVMASACAFAQVGPYVAYNNKSASAAAAVLTVQQPASGGKTVIFDIGYVYCSVACTFTVERDGTAATATAATISKVNAESPAATALAFVDSDVGAGTTISPTYTLAAGESKPIDLSDKRLVGDGTAKNLTIRTSSITGTATLAIKFDEVTR